MQEVGAVQAHRYLRVVAQTDHVRLALGPATAPSDDLAAVVPGRRRAPHVSRRVRRHLALPLFGLAPG